MSKIINSNTWEIMDDTYFEVDDEIAETICILNKKGYKTKYCCEGHLRTYYHKDTHDINELDRDKIKEECPHAYIEDVNNKTYSLLWPFEKSTIYIKFDKDYKFKTLPEEFTKEPSWDDSINDWSKTEFDTIEKRIDCWNNKERRPNNEIYDEIKKYNKILLEWAKELPHNS